MTTTHQNELTIKKQKIILVVDDDKITQKLLDLQLAKQDYRVLLADDGLQAWEAIGKECPDLILLDLMMPGMDGFELCKKIREQYDPEILPIVMLTAKNQPTDLVEGFKMGANDYLVKPYQVEELQARVQMHLRLKDAFKTVQENQRLRLEIEQKEQAEQEVRMTQRRLSRILDNAREAILSVNEIGQIIYLNHSLEELLGFQSQSLLGQPVRSIISTQKGEGSSDLSFPLADSISSREGGATCYSVNFNKSNGQILPAQAFISLFELDDESVYVISVTGSDAVPPVSVPADKVMQTPKLIAELNRNRKRIQDLEDSLIEFAAIDRERRPSLLHELKKIDLALDNLARSFFEDGKIVTARELMVEVMKSAVLYWNENTNATKADLARKSRIWKVYFEQDGRERTQTLDKYLSATTLPKNPRYQKVIQTADFVLTFRKLNSPVRQKLELSLAKLQAFI